MVCSAAGALSPYLCRSRLLCTRLQHHCTVTCPTCATLGRPPALPRKSHRATINALRAAPAGRAHAIFCVELCGQSGQYGLDLPLLRFSSFLPRAARERTRPGQSCQSWLIDTVRHELRCVIHEKSESLCHGNFRGRQISIWGSRSNSAAVWQQLGATQCYGVHGLVSRDLASSAHRC